MKIVKVNLTVGNTKIKVGELEVLEGGMINENEYVGRSRGYSEDGNHSWWMQNFEHLDGGDFHALFTVMDDEGNLLFYYTDFDVTGDTKELNLVPDENAHDKYNALHKAIWG